MNVGPQLLQAIKSLNAEWEITRAAWNDEKGREFEEQFLADLPRQIDRTAEALKEIDKILGKVKRDCE